MMRNTQVLVRFANLFARRQRFDATLYESENHFQHRPLLVSTALTRAQCRSFGPNRRKRLPLAPTLLVELRIGRAEIYFTCQRWQSVVLSRGLYAYLRAIVRCPIQAAEMT